MISVVKRFKNYIHGSLVLTAVRQMTQIWYLEKENRRLRIELARYKFKYEAVDTDD